MAKHPFLPSLLDGIYAKASRPVSWDEVHRLITADASVKQLTGQFRSTGNEELKKALPALTTAVQLNGLGKAAEHITGYTGVVHCDLDRVPDGRMGEALRRIRDDPHTFLCNRSASGRGIHVYARYRMPFPATREEQERLYREAFLRMNCHYADRVGLPFDEQCGNPNKTLSLSHDAEAHYNPEAKPFRLQAPLQHRPASRWVKVERDPFEATEEFAARRGYTYAEGSRNDYLMRCLMHLNKLGVPQAEAERWALAHDGLPQREVLAIVRSCYRHVGEHGSFDPPTTWQREEILQSCNLATLPRLHTHAHEEAGQGRDDNGKPHPFRHAAQGFPEHDWPQFIQQMLEWADSKPQRDVLFLSVVTVMGAMIGRMLRFKYSRRFWHPSLQVFVIAPPASGKSVLTWARRLAEPLDRKLERAYELAKLEYDKKKNEYDSAGRERVNLEYPEPPKMQQFLIAGNNTSSGIIENLEDSGGWALICESEADTLSAAINSEYGKFSHILRQGYDHDLIKMYRRTGKELRRVEEPCLGVLISGTPAQVKPLIVSAENGQFSREVFMTLPAIKDFIDQFDNEECDTDSRFRGWGEEWLALLDSIRSEVGCIELKLSDEQRQRFNECFSQLFHHANGTQENYHMASSVAREAINVLRIMSVVAFCRALGDTPSLPPFRQCRPNGLLQPAGDIPRENVKDGIVARYDLLIRDDDFRACIALAEPIYRNACHILTLLPSTEAAYQELSSVETLLGRLPVEFTRQEAVALATQLDIPESTLDSCLSRLTAQGMLCKPKRGVFAFCSKVESKPDK